jgi:hypothetical protein
MVAAVKQFIKMGIMERGAEFVHIKAFFGVQDPGSSSVFDHEGTPA